MDQNERAEEFARVVTIQSELDALATKYRLHGLFAVWTEKGIEEGGAVGTTVIGCEDCLMQGAAIAIYSAPPEISNVFQQTYSDTTAAAFKRATVTNINSKFSN